MWNLIPFPGFVWPTLMNGDVRQIKRYKASMGEKYNKNIIGNMFSFDGSSFKHMYEDVYKKGYSTLPNLKKLTEGEVFERGCSDVDSIMREKDEALRNQHCFMEANHDPSIYETCADWISKNYPRPFVGRDYFDIAREAPEDFLIHRIEGDKDWLSSAHVCFASHWRPEDKIGRSFDEIHQPVPMNLNNSKKLVHAMIHGGIFERFVWSVVHDERHNFHQRLPYSKFDPNNPKVLIKVERQVTVGFSKHNFCLFILRQYLVKNVDKLRLAEVIEAMSDEQKNYKGLSECDELLRYLRA